MVTPEALSPFRDQVGEHAQILSVSPGFGALTGGSNTSVSVQEGLNQVRTTPSYSLFMHSNPRFLKTNMNCHPSTITPAPPFDPTLTAHPHIP